MKQIRFFNIRYSVLTEDNIPEYIIYEDIEDDDLPFITKNELSNLLSGEIDGFTDFDFEITYADARQIF
jgi:hypothetical protein